MTDRLTLNFIYIDYFHQEIVVLSKNDHYSRQGVALGVPSRSTMLFFSVPAPGNYHQFSATRSREVSLWIFKARLILLNNTLKTGSDSGSLAT